MNDIGHGSLQHMQHLPIEKVHEWTGAVNSAYQACMRQQSFNNIN
jgi:hypothetical protein